MQPRPHTHTCVVYVTSLGAHRPPPPFPATSPLQIHFTSFFSLVIFSNLPPQKKKHPPPTFVESFAPIFSCFHACCVHNNNKRQNKIQNTKPATTMTRMIVKVWQQQWETLYGEVKCLAKAITHTDSQQPGTHTGKRTHKICMRPCTSVCASFHCITLGNLALFPLYA